MSGAVMTLALWVFSRFRGVLGVAQDTSIALLAPAVAAAASAASGGDEARIATGLAVMGISSLLCGIAFWAVGRLGLGRMVRLFPYPVAAGFLAGSGAMLVTAGLFIVTGTHDIPALFRHIAGPGSLLGPVAAVALALCLVTAQKRFSGSTAVLVVIVVFLSGFYATLLLTGTDLATARGLGWLPQSGENLGRIASGLSLVTNVDWQAVLLVGPSLAAVTVLSLIAMLLNTSGVEIATRANVDVNRELQITGAANILIGLFGGLTSFLQAGASILVHKLGVSVRPMVLAHVSVLAVACLFAGQIVAAVPVFVAAGLLMFIGWSMLDDWLIVTRRQLTRGDWRMVVSIVALTLALGILPAVAIGLGLAVLGFAIGYAKLPVIRSATNACLRHSAVDRAPDDAAVIARDGQRIFALRLQGALFFGSIDQMAADIAGLATPAPGLKHIILDFGAVGSIDSSACSGLAKLTQTLGTSGVTLHLADVSTTFVEVLTRWGLELSTDGGWAGSALRLWPSLEEALDHCEEALLDEVLGATRHVDMRSLLGDLAGDDPRLDELLAMLEPCNLTPGEVLIAAGSRPGDVYVLEKGRLGVYLPCPLGTSKKTLVRIMAPGALVGEMAELLDQPRSADVIAQTNAKAWRMPDGLAIQDQGLALLWTRILARALAHKLSQTNHLVADRSSDSGLKPVLGTTG